MIGSKDHWALLDGAVRPAKALSGDHGGRSSLSSHEARPTENPEIIRDHDLLSS